MHQYKAVEATIFEDRNRETEAVFLGQCSFRGYVFLELFSASDKAVTESFTMPMEDYIRLHGIGLRINAYPYCIVY